ncbi:MAG: aldehyde reductase [Paracoccaceae bacterium]
MHDKPVFLTGASGFLAKHVLLTLLREGYAVRASVRAESRADEVRKAVLPHLPGDAAERLSFVALDLTEDAGWPEAMAGCGALVHTASPFPISQPKDADTLVRPAVEGTGRALRGARAAGIDRVVLTSSSVSIIQPWRDENHVFTEKDWSDEEGLPEQPYARSKVMAERAAWQIAEAEGLALTTINPTFILGPVIDAHYGSSIGVVRRVLRGRDPMMPRLGFPVVDVRDVALAHVRALEVPEAAGQRFIASAGSLWMTDWGRILKTVYPKRRMPTRAAPMFVLRLLALFDGEIRAVLDSIGKIERVSSEKARQVLGIDFIDADKALIAAAESLSHAAWSSRTRG